MTTDFPVAAKNTRTRLSELSETIRDRFAETARWRGSVRPEDRVETAFTVKLPAENA
jgi:hypothetical protein